MNFVITENSLKSILHKLKENIDNSNLDNNILSEELPTDIKPKKNKFDGFGAIKKNNNPSMIANVLKNSTSTLYDREDWAENAFYNIKSYDRYLQVKKFLGQDPFKFVQKFADVNKKYFVQPISITMRQIKQTKGKSGSSEKSTTTKSLGAL